MRRGSLPRREHSTARTGLLGPFGARSAAGYHFFAGGTGGGNAATRQALPMIMAALRDDGYSFLKVSELLALR